MAKISEFITSIIAKVDNYYCLNKSLDYNLIISTLKSLENHLVNNSVEFNTDNLSDRDIMSKMLDHHNIFFISNGMLVITSGLYVDSVSVTIYPV